MNIQPIGERVLLTPIKQENRTSGGIYIPSSAKVERKEGVVVAIGTRSNGTALPLNIGDHVIYAGFSATEFNHQNQIYKMVNFTDIIAKVNK